MHFQIGPPSETDPPPHTHTHTPPPPDLVVSVTQPCYHVDYFIGILGMDLHLPDLVEDLTYFSQTGGRYAFIIDDHGTAEGGGGEGGV